MPQQFSPPALDPVSPQGASILELFALAMLPSALIFLLMVGLLAYIVVRYRARPGDGEPAQVEGHRGLEIGWTVGPAVLLAALFLLTVRTIRTVEAQPPDALRVEVVGRPQSCAHTRWPVSWAGPRPRRTSVCMSCGCGEANERHKPGDIVYEDLEKAAKNHDLDVQQVVRNIQQSAQQQAQGGGGR